MKGFTNSCSGGGSNLNLLDNWDFTNPVNQRGKTSYQVQNNDPARVYTIDRWALSNNTTKNKVIVSNNKVSITLSELYSRLYQIVPINNTLNMGKTLTLSVIAESANSLNLALEFYSLDGNSIYSYDNKQMTSSNAESININGKIYKLFKVTITLTANIGLLYCSVINMQDTTSSYSASIIAAKLEFGGISTLKNNLLGVSYARELRKCQKYYQRFNNTSNTTHNTLGLAEIHVNDKAYLPLNLVIPMREKPVITFNNVSIQTHLDDINSNVTSILNCDDYIKEAGIIKVELSSDTSLNPAENSVGLVNLKNGGYIELSADL